MIKMERNNFNGNNSSNRQPMEGDTDHLRKMFIGGLSPATNEDSLRNFFGQWGEIVDVVVMRDPASKRSRGFGFISYSDPSMVDKAQAARPHIIDGKTVDSKRALPRPELGLPSSGSSAIKKIFVGGLKENHDEASLIEHFSQFGKVVSVKILTDKATGRKRGFAFVEFDDYDSVDKAVLHKNHTIKYVLVDVKKSVYKQELAKKFAQQPQGGMAPTGGSHPGGYQQPPGPYNAQAPYYPPQMPPPAYNGWGGYPPHPAAGYQQPPPYGPYGGPPPAGAPAWNAGSYPPQQWNANGYSAPPTGQAQAAAAPTAAPVASAAGNVSASQNGWAPQQGAPSQNFGDYQQSYNGGPQKAGNLHGNRMNPYNVSATSNYGYNCSKQKFPTDFINMYTTNKKTVV